MTIEMIAAHRFSPVGTSHQRSRAITAFSVSHIPPSHQRWIGRFFDGAYLQY